MKIVIAPDSYKGCLSSIDVANAIEKGIKKVDKSIKTVIIPIADGGEGTVNAFVKATNGYLINTRAHNPMMNIIDTYYGILGDQQTAIIEMAAISGLNLIDKAKQNPLYTTTFGTGELIKHALDQGIRNIIVGIGGSATNDGGLGMAKALGGKFYDDTHHELPQGGNYLNDLATIDLSALDKRISECTITVACDVKNPLYGENGASYIYGKQKGASDEDIILLDQGLRHLSKVLQNDNEKVEGAGAAGGLGYGLISFLNASLKPGINIIKNACQFEKHIKDADLLITGEGQTDSQTAYGKAPVGLASSAKKFNVPVICISGALGKDYEKIYDQGIDGAFSIIPSIIPLEQAIKDAAVNLEQFSYSIINTIMQCKK